VSLLYTRYIENQVVIYSVERALLEKKKEKKKLNGFEDATQLEGSLSFCALLVH
jgi:hypothetical protein